MPLQTVLAVLAADATVTGLVAIESIQPVIASQNLAPPFVTLQVLGVTPQNHLQGFGALDECHVVVTAWATTYTAALAIGNAARTALQNAGHLCESRDADQFSSDPDPGVYHIEHQFLIWK